MGHGLGLPNTTEKSADADFADLAQVAHHGCSNERQCREGTMRGKISVSLIAAAALLFQSLSTPLRRLTIAVGVLFLALAAESPAVALCKSNQSAAACAATQKMNVPSTAGVASATNVVASQPDSLGRQAHPLPVDNSERALIRLGIIGISLLAAIVALFPLVAYVFKSWGWREHIIFCSLSAKAKNKYLILYHRQLDNEATADARFATFYRRWFGRARLVIPLILIGIVVSIYAFIVACYAAQQLYGYAIIYLPRPDASKDIFGSVEVAIAAIAGAYTLVTLDAIGRVIRRDLSAEDLYLYALRFMSCVPVGYALSSLVKPQAAMVIAFTVGAFPLQMIADILRRNAQKQLGSIDIQDTVNDPITKLAGVDGAVFDRVSGIGISTVGQLAESDPIQLTMRTNMTFSYLLDLTSQALAWNYLETKLETLRPMGLRGACELGVLNAEAQTIGSPFQANAAALIAQVGPAIGLTAEQFKNVLHQIADDPYTAFLNEAYG